MDKSCDPGELLQLHEKNHKSQPVQFNSVAVGEKLSLDTQNNKRRTSRLTFPDNIINIPKCESLVPPKTDKKTKLEHKMEQLQLWKQEKERKKMEAALNKTKPFLVGVVHNPKILSFAPKNTTFNSTQNVVKLPLNTPSTDAKKGTSKLSLGLNSDNRTKSKALKSGSGKNNKNNAQSKSSESSSIVDPSLPIIVKKRVFRKRTETVLSKKISLTSESSGLLDDGVYKMDILDHCEQQLDSEIKRASEMRTWNKLFQLVPLPEAIKETVLGSVGQARLLMSQNMHQFATLLTFTILFCLLVLNYHILFYLPLILILVMIILLVVKYISSILKSLWVRNPKN